MKRYEMIELMALRIAPYSLLQEGYEYWYEVSRRVRRLYELKENNRESVQNSEEASD